MYALKDGGEERLPLLPVDLILGSIEESLHFYNKY